MLTLARLTVWLLVLAALAAAGLAGWQELNASPLQARILSRLGNGMQYRVEPGISDSIRFPVAGPFDERLGYTALPNFGQRLIDRGFGISSQARISPQMARVIDFGLFAPYHEKTRAGLIVQDCAGDPLFAVQFPERFYVDFNSVPRQLVDSLLFIENRELLSSPHRTRNPAIEWDRFARAAIDQFLSRLNPDHDSPGGSTLATQIEKYRHSPGGRTSSGEQKLRQMASASLRAYLDGEDTTKVRKQLVVDYLNTVPLAAWPGYGEVIGIGDGLWVWYGRDFNDFNRILRDESIPAGEKALAYKQALSLMISQRRPSEFLVGELALLNNLTDTYLRLMTTAGIITPAFRDEALAVALVLRQGGMAAPRSSFMSRKAANLNRTHLAGLLGVRKLYELDRLDLTASSTLDIALQEAISDSLRDISDTTGAAAAGLTGERLLAGSDPSQVIYSFTLLERTGYANVVRAQTDNFDQPLDINAGTRLDLGSTAKLRTLVTYLEIVARLYAQLASLSAEELRARPVASQDRISRWAVDYLLQAPDDRRTLGAMLGAAMDRRYSASPAESFFTGGGLLTFENFDPIDNNRVLSVSEGLQRSVNLVFVRLMRDIVQHTIATLPSASASLLDDRDDPKRKEYLARFADREGSEFLRRFYRQYEGKTADEARARLLRGMRPTPKRLATVFRSLDPEAGIEEFTAFLHQHLPEARVADDALPRLYRDYAIERFNLADRGYIAGIHPLELWLVSYLRAYPGATLPEVIKASSAERQAVYSWLFKTRRKGAQDRRIRSLIELEAFLEIHKSWQRLGYPFDSLAPSYATALGSSADRPAALAELVGILLNDGVRLPTWPIDALHFAASTPYETTFTRRPLAGERVLPVEVARTVRAAMALVVKAGTAKRLDGVFTDAAGEPLTVGGKTGTGDHRFETYGKGGQLLSSRVISRSGTFVFFIGDRYFGALTAYVKGPDAARYRFTSALPTQILKTLAPKLQKVLNREPRVGTTCAVDAPLRRIRPEPEANPVAETPAGNGPPEALDTARTPPAVQPDVSTPEAASLEEATGQAE